MKQDIIQLGHLAASGPVTIEDGVVCVYADKGQLTVNDSHFTEVENWCVVGTVDIACRQDSAPIAYPTLALTVASVPASAPAPVSRPASASPPAPAATPTTARAAHASIFFFKQKTAYEITR